MCDGCRDWTKCFTCQEPDCVFDGGPTRHELHDAEMRDRRVIREHGLDYMTPEQAVERLKYEAKKEAARRYYEQHKAERAEYYQRNKGKARRYYQKNRAKINQAAIERYYRSKTS